MPLNGVWSGRGGDVRVASVSVYHFPEDKETRDHVHARLAKKIAERKAKKIVAREALKDAAPGAGA